MEQNNQVQNKSPRESINKILKSKLLVAICIILTFIGIFALIGFITSFNQANSMKETFKGLASMIKSYLGIDISVVAKIIDAVAGFLIAVAALEFAIAICPVIAAWLLMAGGKKDSERLKKIGSKLIKISAFIKLSYSIVTVILITAVTIIVANLGIEAWIVAILFFMLISWNLYDIIYSFVFFEAAFTVPFSYKHNRNAVAGLIPLMIIYMLMALSAIVYNIFGGWSGILKGILLTVLYFMLFFIVLNFRKEYKEKVNLKEVVEEIKAERGSESEEEPENAAQPVLPQPKVEQVKAEKPKAESAKPEQNAKPAVNNNNNIKAVAPNVPAVSNVEVEKVISKFFAAKFDEKTARFEVLSEGAFESKDKQFVLKRYQILRDSISKKTLLRLEAQNNYDIEVAKIGFEVQLKNKYSQPIGFIKDAVIDSEIIKAKSLGLASIGIMIPSEAAVGTIEINRITFNDGLFVDDEKESYTFISKEKTESDFELFMKLSDTREGK